MSIKPVSSILLAVVLATQACHLRPRSPEGPPEWTAVALPGVSPDAQVVSLGGSGPHDVWALIHNAAGPGTGTRVFHYDGRAWAPAARQPEGGALSDIFATSPTDVWAVGDGGRAVHFDGAEWTTTTVPDAVSARATLTRVRAWPGEARAGMDVPDDARRYRFRAGVWSPDDASMPGNGRPYPEFWGASPTDVWLAGPRARHFDGTTWTEFRLHASEPHGGLVLRDVHGTAGDDVWMVGGRGSSMSQNHWRGAAFRWDGARWAETPVPEGVLFLWRVFAVSRTEAWAVGGGADAIRWDGRTWRRSLTGFERAGNVPSLRTLFAVPGHAWAAGPHVPGLIEHLDRPTVAR